MRDLVVTTKARCEYYYTKAGEYRIHNRVKCTVKFQVTKTELLFPKKVVKDIGANNRVRPIKVH